MSTDNAKTAASSARARSLRQILEPRVLLDAAAAGTLVDEAQSQDDGDLSLLDQDETLFDGGAVDDSEGQRKEVYFIDTNVPGYQDLISQVPEGAEVFILDPGASGLEMMRQALDGLGYQVDAIHLVSHGDAGAFRAGYDVITSGNPYDYQSQLGQIAEYIAADGDFLIYGCDVAAGPDGQAFLDALADQLGADVAASDNVTGPNGDLILEVSSGEIETESWQGLSLLTEDLALDLLHVGDQTDTGQMGRFMDGEGQWVVAGGWDAGKAIVYKVDGATRTPYTLDTTGLPGTWTSAFGRGVAISGNTIAIGDPAAGSAGRVAIFQQTGTGSTPWVYVTTLEIPGSSRVGPWDSTYSSGGYLALDGNHIAVGAPSEGSNSGRVFWFADTSGGGWTTIASGQFDEPQSLNDDTPERFGATIAIAKDYMIIAAPTADTNGDDGYFGGGNQGNHGRVYVYNWAEGSGSAPDIYQVSDGDAFNYLAGEQDADGTVNGGESVENARLGGALDMEYYDNSDNGIDDGRYTIVLGATGEDGGRGEIYIYQTAPINGAGMDSLATTGAVNIYGQTTGGGGDRFGSAVAVSEGRLVVGAPEHNATSDTAVFYYEAPGNNWSAITANTNNPAAFGILVREIKPTGPSPDWGAGWKMGRGLAFTAGNNLAVGGPGNSRVGFFFIRTPVAAGDSFSVNENAGVNTYNILANEVWGTVSPSSGSVELLTSTQSGDGTFTWNNTTRRLEYNTDGLYEYLAAGESTTVNIQYRLTADGFTTTALITVTINGQNDVPVVREGILDQEVPHATNGTPNSGSIAITNRAFFDVDETDVLTYAFVSAVSTGQGNGGTVGTAAPGGAFGVSGSNINYNLSLVPEYSQWQVTIQADDGNGGTVQTTFIFTVARNNATPTVGVIPDYTTDEDAIFSEDISGNFADADFGWVDPNTGDTLDFPEGLTYSIVNRVGNGGDWLVIGANTGVLTGVPVNDNVGVHTVTVRATDRYGEYVEQTFDITVDNVNDAPILVNPIPRQEATVADPAVSFNFNVVTDPDGPFFTDVDPTGDVITYTAEFLDGTGVTTGAPALPQADGNWLRFNGTTFSGIPTDDLGTIFTVRLIANDGNGGVTETLFEIGVFPEEGDADVITSGTSAAGNLLGTASAISGNGNWAVFGSPGNNQVQIYEFSGGSWLFRQQFAGAAGSLYGAAVDISNDGSRIVVGAPRDISTGSTRGGAVHYLQRTGATWATAGTTRPTNAEAGDRFGEAVAINDNGTQVLIGSPYDNEAGTNAGAAYRFNWATASNTEANLGKILPQFDTGEAGNARSGDTFGSSVAFNGDMMVIGSPRDDHSGRADAGAAYVYQIGTGGYIKLIKEGNIASADYFGRSVSLDRYANSLVVVAGAAGDDTVALNAGGAYVYRTDTVNVDNLASLTWSASIHAYDAVINGQFGYSVSVDVQGDVGGSGRTRIAISGSLSGSGEGAVYAYRYSNTLGWVGQRFEANNTGVTTTAGGNHLGTSVGIAGTQIVAGAPYAERNTAGAAGLAYGFSIAGDLIETITLSGTGGKVLDNTPPPVVGTGPGTGSETGGGTNDGSNSQSVTPSLLNDELQQRQQRLSAQQVDAAAMGEAGSVDEYAQLDSSSASSSVVEELLYDLQVRQEVQLSQEALEPAAEQQTEQLLAALAGFDSAADASPSVDEIAADASAMKEQLFGFSRQLDSLYVARAERSQRLLNGLSGL